MFVHGIREKMQVIMDQMQVLYEGELMQVKRGVHASKERSSGRYKGEFMQVEKGSCI